MITADPGAMPFTLPFASTVATAEPLLVHVTVLKSVVLGSTVAFSEAVLPVLIVSAVFDILTPAGKMGVTVTVQLAEAPLPSFAVQVITAVPPAFPVTTPELDTEATLGLRDVQFTFLLLAVTGSNEAISLTFSFRAIVASPRFSEMAATGC